MPTTTYMSMVLPTVSVTVGPDWATTINTALTLNDGHTHLPGSGMLIATAALNINADLTFGTSYAATNLHSTGYAEQGSTLASSYVRRLYFYGGNLYANNTSGTAIQITSGGALYTSASATTVLEPILPAGNLTILAGAPHTTTVDVMTDTTSARIHTLPAANAVTAGRFYIISDKTGTAGTYAITVNRAGADTIDGGTSVTLQENYGSLLIRSDGASKWFVSRMSKLPNAGGLTAGNVLRATSANVVAYSTLDLSLAGTVGSSVLPSANMFAATTGTAGSVKLANDLGGTSALPTVLALTGTASVVQMRASSFEFDTGLTPAIFQTAKASSGAGASFTIQAQQGHTNGDGGALILCGGQEAGTGLKGTVKVMVGGSSGTTMLAASEPEDGLPVVSLGGEVTVGNYGSSSGCVWIKNAGGLPVFSPIGGMLLYSDAGIPTFMDTSGNKLKLLCTTVSTSVADSSGPSLAAVKPTTMMRIVYNGTTYKIPLYSNS